MIFCQFRLIKVADVTLSDITIKTHVSKHAFITEIHPVKYTVFEKLYKADIASKKRYILAMFFSRISMALSSSLLAIVSGGKN